MERANSFKNENIVYDPQVLGYDEVFWKTLSGTPVPTSNKLRLNAADIVSRVFYRYCDLRFWINFPSTPTEAVLVCGAIGESDITVWDQITDGEFAITIDGTAYDIEGIDFSGGVYTPAYLTGGSSATSNYATWEAVTDGEFAITIDGTARDITGIDFTGVTDMDEVAAAIQAAVRAVTSGTETVEWDTDHFVISSGDATSSSAVSVTSAVSGGAGTDISGVGATAYLDGETAVGTVTKRAMADYGDFLAGVIEDAIQAATGSTETCVFDTDHFVITSVETDLDSSITVLSSVSGGAGTDISGASYMNGDAGNGTATQGGNMFFGFNIPSLGDAWKIGFDVEGDQIFCVIYDEDGALVTSHEVSWDASTWNTNDIEFRVSWAPSLIKFWINGACVFEYSKLKNVNAKIPDVPMMIRLKQDVVINVDIACMIMRNIYSLGT